MSTVKQAVAFVCVAAAGWMTQATLALADAGIGVDRIALLPVSASAIGVALFTGGLAIVAVRRGLSLAAFAPLTLVVLPWLPFTIPAAFLLWSGPLKFLAWTACLAAAAVHFRRRWSCPMRHPPVLAGAIALVVFSVAAWRVAPNVPGGDEPHYLVITQSLLHDGDLKIENNHRRGEYRTYFAGELRPDFLKRGQNGEIYSIHAPGLPAVLAPAFALAGYPGVVAWLVLVSALGSALAWHLAWLQTRRTEAAWFGWAAVTLGVTAVFHSFSIYPDGLGGVLTLTGVWALMRAEADERTRTWFLHGAALALLPWLHSRFALLAGTLGVLILLRLWFTPDRVRKAMAFVTVPAVSCAGWLGYFAVIYGIADPSAPYGEGQIGSAAYIADGLAGLFFDQRFGLLTYAPVLVFAAAGFAVMRNRLAVELLLVIVPYLIVVTNFRMWWAGWSAPARFAVPILLLLAIPAAKAWTALRRRGTGVIALGALALTILTTFAVVFIEHGSLAYNVRTEPSLWARWIARNADLVRALPAWSVREAELFQDIAIWCAVLLLAWIVVRGLDGLRALRGRAALTAAAAGVFAIAGMAAPTIIWRVRDLAGIAPAPAQMELLRRAAMDPRLVFVGLQPPRRMDRDSAVATLRIRPELMPPPDAPAGESALLFAVSAVPAGEYRLWPRARGAGGRLTIGVGRDELSMLNDGRAASIPIVVRLPVDVGALLVRGDDEARRSIRDLAIEPVFLVPRSDRLTDEFARHAVMYETAMVFFLDERSFPEPEAFWVAGGARHSSVVIRPDTPRETATLLVRNAPVDNRVTIESGQWRQELQMVPGEERRIHVPFDPARGASLVRFSVSSGFRPSQLEPASRDDRYLGVWVKVL
jgi:hypothetical protein